MDERTASILQMREQGLSYQQIADATGTSRGTVWKALKGGSVNGNGPTKAAKIVHRCATPGCGRELKNEQWVYSSHTGLRYCPPGAGCWKWSDKKRRSERERSQEGARA